jgi:hypothetical protein
MQLLLEQMNGYVLVAVLVLCILVLSKATDILVDEAISLSLEWGCPNWSSAQQLFLWEPPYRN